MTATFKTDPPLFMEEGSRGPVVDLVIEFLITWAGRHGHNEHRLIVNGVYDENVVHWMQRFQIERDIEVASGCGSEVREAMRGLGFDFGAEAKRVGPRLTVFVQPGPLPILYWGPGIEPQHDKTIAEKLLAVAHGI